MTKQGEKIQAWADRAGITPRDYTGTFHAAADAMGIPPGPTDARMVTYLQRLTGSDETNLMNLEALAAKQRGADHWGALGLEVGDTWFYEFDGSTMYATIPDYDANGLPTRIAFEFNANAPGTGRDYVFCSSDGKVALSILATSATLQLDYTDADGTTARTVTGPTIASATNYQGYAQFNADGVDLVVNGTTYSSANAPSPPANLTNIASSQVPGDYFDGKVLNIRATDDSPLQNRYTLDGNGTRYIEIPRFEFGATDEFSIKWQGIRAPDVGSADQCIVGDSQATNSWVLVRAKDNATQPDWALLGREGANTIDTNAFISISGGQHYEAEYRRSSGKIQLLVNGELFTNVNEYDGAFGFDRIGAYSTGGLPTPTGSTAGTVILENLTTGEYVEYRIDEGPGTTVKAYDRHGSEIPALAGTITPNAAWTLQPDNSRFYPMGDNDATLKCYDGTGQRKPSADGTIVNHNPANWS